MPSLLARVMRFGVKVTTRPLATVSITPEQPHLEQEVKVEVTNLKPGSHVHLQLSLETDRGSFLSPRVSRPACQDGRVELGGPLDLMSCMVGENTRYYETGPMPRLLQYRVLVGSHGQEVVSKDFVRVVYGQEVRRLQVDQQGGVKGTLFLPDNSEDKPGVLCISGAARVKEDLAAFFASKGFPTLALGYYGMTGLPR